MKEKYKIKISYFGLSFVILAFVCMSIPKIAYASQVLQNPLVVKQSIEIDTGYAKSKDEFIYFIEPITKGAPLPNDSKEKYSFPLIGEDNKELSINFSEVGDYVYKIYQEKRSDIKNCKQDLRNYTVTIRVIKSGQDLIIYTYSIIDDKGYKHEVVDFKNTYSVDSNIIRRVLPQTGDSTNIYQYIGVLCLSGVAFTILLAKRRKRY